MGSVASKMSADPRTRLNGDSPGPVAAVSTLPPAPHNLPHHLPPTRSRPAVPLARASSSSSATRDINALRAAALKSSRKQKLKAEAAASRSQSATPAPPPAREEGEISDSEDTPVAPIPATLPSLPVAPPAPGSPGITRSTIVTLSPNQGSSQISVMSKEEETQYLATLRSLMNDLGVSPEQLVNNGAPVRLVAQACEEIVTSHKSTGTITRDDIWRRTRSPVRENSGTPGLPEATTSTRESRANSRSRHSSPDVEVTVRTNRALSQSSDSSIEAIVERMVPPQPLPPQHQLLQPPAAVPRVTPVSSWVAPPSLPSRPAPPLPPPQAAVRVDGYYPLARPTTAAIPISPTATAAAATAQNAAVGRPSRRRRRDLDSAASFPATLDYGDDDTGNEVTASSSRPPEPAVAPPPPPPPPAQRPPPSPPRPAPAPIKIPPPSASSAPSPAPSSAIAEDLAEARRRLLESMKRRKTGTPISAPPSSLAATAPVSPKPSPAAEQATAEQDLSGSATEAPMDIDMEMEDGEIADDSSSGGTSSAQPEQRAPVQPTAIHPPAARSSRGVKRPLAEDLMDVPSRPTSAARLAPPRRKIFCITAQRTTKLSLALDDDSESESEDEEPTTCFEPPVIEIPPDWETFQKNEERRAIAEKEEHIRRLREKIAALAAKKKQGASAQATPTGALTPATAQNIAESVLKAATASTQPQTQSPTPTDTPPKEDCEGDGPAEDAGMDIDEPESKWTPAGASDPAPTQNHFQPYQPFLFHYPQLASSNQPTTDDDNGNDSELTLDWGLMSSIILTHRLQRDPDATMCQFEAGGGRCTNVKCEDVHLVRVEPTDDDLVAYVSQILALEADSNDQDPPDSAAILEALMAARGELSGTANHPKTRVGKKKAEGSKASASSQGLAGLLDMTARRLRAR